MISTEVKIQILQNKINKAESRGNASSGCVRKWRREIRNLSK